MKRDQIHRLKIDRQAKQRSKRSVTLIFLMVGLVVAGTIYFAVPRAGDDRRVMSGQADATATGSVKESSNASASESSAKAAKDGEPVPRANGVSHQKPSKTEPDGREIILTTSGYIINRERIEISPRFQGIVTWIGVKKGDAVGKNQIVVRLDDSEYQARRLETQGRLEAAQARSELARIRFERTQTLLESQIETVQNLDNARLEWEAAKAAVKELQGGLKLIETYIDWTVIRSPIQGVVLEKLVDPNELVVPQSFGGTRGPSTALIAVADPKDLQVEIDLNEADLAKVRLNQSCRVSPEAYPDRHYRGFVAEMAPEADRQKGTLEIKVQIREPDAYLTPELSARVDFFQENNPAL